VAISSGLDYTLGLKGDGTIVAWGDSPPIGASPALGTHPILTNIPPNLTNIVAISAGEFDAMALKADGTVVVWGDGSFGQTNVPAAVSQVIDVSLGNFFCLALKANHTVVGWGWNANGNTDVPKDLTNAIAITAGPGNTSLALRSDGTVMSWGGGTNVFLNNVVAISAGTWCSAALRADGTVWSSQTPPADLTNVTAISARGYYPMALKADGSIIGWGQGAGDTFWPFSWGQGFPPLPPGLSGVTAIAESYLAFYALADVPRGGPIISYSGPPMQTTQAGGQAFFSIAAQGDLPFQYQWYFGNTPIFGATNRWLTLDNVATTQAGAYSVVVSNSKGSATSQPLMLNVVPSLDVNMVPAITLKGGAGQNFRIDYINAVGPTNAWTTLATVTLTNNQQFYSDYSAIGQPVRLYRLVQLP
jgi:hypothetical protein